MPVISVDRLAGVSRMVTERRMHPDTKALAAFRDGRLGRVSAAVVRVHLRKCSACSQEVKLMGAVVGAGESPQKVPSIAGLEDLLARARRWSESGPAESSAVRRRVAAELQPLLGRRATSEVLTRVAEDNRDLLCKVEAVLVNFVGPKAAASVVHRVVDAALVSR
jgi:hypothetical protein